MADIFTVEKRSEIMSRIKSKNTGPELKMASMLKDKSIPFKMHAQLIGKPDFVLHEMGIILFVDGEFWHGHTMTERKRETIGEFWVKKIDRNIERDIEVTAALKKMGWAVIRVSDREVNKSPDSVMSKIWRVNGQLLRSDRKTDPDERIKTLRKTLRKKSTKASKSKKTRQNAQKQAK